MKEQIEGGPEWKDVEELLAADPRFAEFPFPSDRKRHWQRWLEKLERSPNLDQERLRPDDGFSYKKRGEEVPPSTDGDMGPKRARRSDM